MLPALRLLPDLRRSDRPAFQRWLNRYNTIRTRVIGWILVGFALLNTLASLLHHDPVPPQVYAGYGGTILLGLAMSHLGLARGYRRAGHAGEWLILAVAIGWMFHAAATNLEAGHGLAEFVIGTLALAIFRGMHPALAVPVFASLGLIYTGLLWLADLIAYTPVVNASVACAFAAAWSWTSYRSRLIEFRSEQLLRRLQVQNRELRALALQDPLTGLPNRRYFDTYTSRHWRQPERQQQPLTLVLADIDHFKEYNDRHGHPQGDACLRQVADLIRRHLHADGVAVRFGGEEFAILLPGVDLVEARAVAEEVLGAVARRTTVTLSCGIARLTPTDGSVAALYQQADLALYQAKLKGRNCVEVAAADGHAAAS